jgi:ENTS family enterobactin (siderophore) exporter
VVPVGRAVTTAVIAAVIAAVTAAVTAAGIAALAVNAVLPAPRGWFVYVAAVLAVGVSGLGAPARRAATPSPAAPGHPAAAGASTTPRAQLGVVVGPSLAGVRAAGPPGGR